MNDFEDEQATASSGVVDEFEAAAVERFGIAVGRGFAPCALRRGFLSMPLRLSRIRSSRPPYSGHTKEASARSLRLACYGSQISMGCAEVMMPQPEGMIALPGDTSRESISLDLVGLSGLYSPMAEAIRRYVSAIQIRRGDYAGKVITLRRDDITVLASVLGTTNAALIADLEAKGLVVKR